MTKNISPFAPGSVVAGYFRDSGGNDQDLSVSRQISEFKRWCAEHDLVVGEIFRDDAKKGSTVIGRADFLRMARHFRSGTAREAGLVVWRFSRFGRNTNERQYYKADLRRLGYIIHSLTDNIPNDKFGKLYENFLDFKDEIFLEELSEEVSSGLRNIVENYKCLPGTPPRGFLREPVVVGQRRNGQPHILHKWVPDPNLTDLVRRAFLMAAQGRSLQEIQLATGLFASGNSYVTFFRKPIYKGVLRYKDLVLEDYCDPIVEPEIWERVQRILDTRAQRVNITSSDPKLHPRRVASTWLLSGLLFCARCGAPMNGHAIKGWDYYACSRAKRRHDCDAPKIPAPRIEDLVRLAIRDYINNPAAVQEAQSKRASLYNQAVEDTPMRLRELDTRLANLRRQITNLTNAIADAGHSTALLKQLSAFEMQEAELKEEYDQLAHLIAAKPTAITPARIARLSAQFERVWDTGTIDDQRAILAGWVREIRAERVDRQILSRIELYIPPISGPDPPTAKLGLQTAPPWRHTRATLAVALCLYPRGRHEIHCFFLLPRIRHCLDRHGIVVEHGHFDQLHQPHVLPAIAGAGFLARFVRGAGHDPWVGCFQSRAFSSVPQTLGLHDVLWFDTGHLQHRVDFLGAIQRRGGRHGAGVQFARHHRHPEPPRVQGRVQPRQDPVHRADLCGRDSGLGRD